MGIHNSTTPVSFQPWNEKISHKDSIFSIGSCFSAMIGDYLLQNKINALSNPFGTIYDPISIERCINNAINSIAPDKSRFTQVQDVHLHFNYHSNLSALSQQHLSDRINEIQTSIAAFLKKSNWVIITMGSAIVYRLKADGDVVANCHKQNQSLFTKDTLDANSICQTLTNMVNQIEKVNPETKLVFTVSPVRHARHGLPENMYSKSLLRLAVQEMVNAHRNCYYFPSYEIMMDELRDYRYYKNDGIHPTQEAEAYIWQQFLDNTFDEASRQLIEQWQKIRLAINHRPLHAASKAHQKFLQDTILKLENLSAHLNVEEEIQTLKAKIDAI